MRRLLRVFITCFAGLIALVAPPAVAQRPRTPEETRALDSLQRIRDSIAYARELATADSIIPFIPTDSLRALYRAVATGADPIAAIKAIPCEAYRLWHKYGYPADIAEQRIRGREWTEEHDASIRRAFDTLYHAGPYHTGLTSALPTRVGCGGGDGAPPARRAWAPVDPRTFDRFLSRGLSRDSLRLGPTYFEGAASIRHAGQDSTVEFAGRANIQFTSDMFLELRLNDWTRKNDITGFYFRRSGPQLLRAGTYPIVGNADFFETRPDANIFMYYGQSEALRGDFGRYPRIRGTVTVDRADTSGAAGHLEFWVEADDPPAGWWQRNIASFRWLQQAGVPSADELHVRATFRARYDNGDEQLSRVVSHFPLFPRRLEHSDPAPDAALIARHFFLDEREPCEKLPVYSHESVLSSLPPTYPGVSARARLNIVTDSSGRARGGTPVMAIEDTSLAGTFGLQTGLRFERTAPDQLIGRVRCTLTLRKEH